MEIVWTLVAIAPIALITVACHRLLALRWRLQTLIWGFACGAATGLYLFALGELAFRYSVEAWLPGALFQLHTFALAMVSLAANQLAGGGDTMVVGAMEQSRAIRLLWKAGICVMGYGFLGILMARLVVTLRGRER